MNQYHIDPHGTGMICLHPSREDQHGSRCQDGFREEFYIARILYQDLFRGYQDTGTGTSRSFIRDFYENLFVQWMMILLVCII